MPGAAGRKAVNHIYSTAKPDGLAIGAVGAGLVAGPILGLPGSQYDIDKLIYLGSTESGDPYVFVSRKEAGFDSLEKLRAATGLRIGAQAVGHPVFISGRMFAYLLGLKEPRMVVGYGGPEMDIALAKGEIDLRANGADTIFQRNREGLQIGQLNFHASITIPKGNFIKGLPKAPELESFAKNDKERQMINLFRAFLYPRWPYIVPPATPKEVVANLARRHGEGFQRSRVSQGIQKTHEPRADAAHRRGNGNRDPRIAARPRNRRALQENGRAGPAAAEVERKSSNRSSRSAPFNPTSKSSSRVAGEEEVEGEQLEPVRRSSMLKRVGSRRLYFMLTDLRVRPDSFLPGQNHHHRPGH